MRSCAERQFLAGSPPLLRFQKAKHWILDLDVFTNRLRSRLNLGWFFCERFHEKVPKRPSDTSLRTIPSTQ